MLGSLADQVFGRLGYVLMRRSNFNLVRGTLGWERLSSIPMAPKTIIDVGVGYGTPELYEAFPGARLILVEPLEEYLPNIRALFTRRGGVHHAVALGASDGELEINVEPEMQLKSSFLARTTETATGHRTSKRRVPVRRLDALLANERLDGPVGLKIDVEGFELEVLRGAPQTLARIDFVIIETSVARRFEGSPSFADIVGEMARHKFEVYDVLHVARGEGPGARHADLLFMRP